MMSKPRCNFGHLFFNGYAGDNDTVVFRKFFLME